MDNDSIFGLAPLARRKKNAPDARLTITPLGGLGEIGMNCQLWSTGKAKVIVDCGLMFPNDYHLGIDVVIPRFDIIKELRDDILGIVLTHGHEDHIGALPWLVPHLPKPVIYGSPFTLALVEHKLRERNLLDRCSLVNVSPATPVQLGDLRFHFFSVCHSIIDGYALGVETPAGKVVHTGDFKLDKKPLEGPSTDIPAISRFVGRQGAALLLSDSTNVEREGHSLTEQDVLTTLRGLFQQAQGRIIVTLFSSHIQRIQEVFDCAAETGRPVAVSGRSLMNNITMSKELGRLSPPPDLYMDTAVLPAESDKLVLLVTGSQGEPLSALSRIIAGDHKHLSIREGDMVILSSRLIPSNTMAVNAMVNNLYRLGAEVYHDKDLPVHASGHAYKGELQTMLRAVKPKYFVPVHGEYRHLIKHCRLAVECGVEKGHAHVVENGQPFSLTPDGFFFEEPVLAESILVDGKGVGDVGRSVLKERHLLGDEGMVVVVLVLDEETGTVLQGPEVFSKGFVFEQDYAHVLEDAKCLILDILEDRNPGDPEKIQVAIRSSLRRFFRKVLGRDPVVMPIVASV